MVCVSGCVMTYIHATNCTHLYFMISFTCCGWNSGLSLVFWTACARLHYQLGVMKYIHATNCTQLYFMISFNFCGLNSGLSLGFWTACVRLHLLWLEQWFELMLLNCLCKTAFSIGCVMTYIYATNCTHLYFMISFTCGWNSGLSLHFWTTCAKLHLSWVNITANAHWLLRMRFINLVMLQN